MTDQGKKPDIADLACRSPRARLSLFATPVSMYDLPTMEVVNRDLTERLVAESTSLPPCTAVTSAGGTRRIGRAAGTMFPHSPPVHRDSGARDGG